MILDDHKIATVNRIYSSNLILIQLNTACSINNCYNFCFNYTNLLLGRGLTLKILRRTAQCDNGLEELKPVDQNLQYDFNYQQFTFLPEEITVFPVSGYEYVKHVHFVRGTCRERE